MKIKNVVASTPIELDRENKNARNRVKELKIQRIGDSLSIQIPNIGNWGGI